jgi:hypothetical protein
MTRHVTRLETATSTLFCAIVAAAALSGCGAGLKHTISAEQLARVPVQQQRTLDPLVEKRRSSQLAAQQSKQQHKLAEHAEDAAEAKEDLAEKRVDFAKKKLKSAKKGKKLEAIAQGEAQLDVARREYNEAKLAHQLAEKGAEEAEAKHSAADKRALLAAAELELNKAKLLRTHDKTLKIGDFEEQLATTRKELGEAEEQVAELVKEREELQAKQQIASRATKKAKLKYGTVLGS